MTEEMKIVVVSAILSLIASIFAAVITSKLTLKRDVKKRIHEKREDVYIACFDLLQAVKDDPYLVFNNARFYTPLCELRTKLNLFASKDVIKILEPLYKKFKETIEAYWDLFAGEEYEMLKQARAEHEGLTDIDFQNDQDAYIENHLIDAKLVETTMENIVAAMRNDLGTR